MLTQLTFVSWWQMIYDMFISSHMITHWCFVVPWCSRWAVRLLCAECPQPLVTVHFSNPALEAATYSYSGFFICLCCWSSSAKQRMCRVHNISHLQMFDLTIAITLPRGRRGGILPTQGSGEDKSRTVPSGATAANSPANSKPPAQTLHLHLHLTSISISIHNFLPSCKPPLPLPTTYPTYTL